MLNGPCNPATIERDELIRLFPVGSRLNVIGIKSKYFQNAGDKENIKLETGFRGSLSPTIMMGNEFDSSINAETDYKALVNPQKHISEKVFEFELRKEFIRLESTDPPERVKTLRRLAFFPGRILYDKIVENYLEKDHRAVSELKDLRKIFAEEFFKINERTSRNN